MGVKDLTGNTPRFPLPLAAVFLVMSIFGLPAVYDRMVSGHVNAGYGQIVPWGLWVSSYVFFIGISTGAFAFSALTRLFDIRRYRPLSRLALFIACVSLVAALFFISADLGHPERAVSLLLRPNLGSLMAWMFYLYTAYALVLVAELWIVMRPAQTKNERRLRFLDLVGLTIAVCASGGLGSLFAAVGSRPFWHTSFLPVTFVISSLLSGIAFVLAGTLLVMRGGHAFKQSLLMLGRVLGVLLVAELIALITESFVIVKGAIPSHVAVLQAIAAGPFAWVFWGVQLGGGMLLPLALIYLVKPQTLKATAVACLLILAGVFAFRLNLVIPQLAQPAFAALPEVYVHPRTVAVYVPTFMEWNLLLFGVGLAGLLFLVGSRLLPLVPHDVGLEFELATGRAHAAKTG